MKNIFTILLILCPTITFAQDTSVKRNDSVSSPAQKDTAAAGNTTNTKDSLRDSSARANMPNVDSFLKTLNTEDTFIDTTFKSEAKKDTSQAPAASPIIETPPPQIDWKEDTAFIRLLNISNFTPYYIQTLKDGEPRTVQQKDDLFYALVAILFLLGFIRAAFPRYFQNVFRMFFQTSLRNRQTKEQQARENLPSLIMNLFFVLSGGLFISLLALENNWLHITFLSLTLYCTVVLSMLYLGKFLFISFAGWIFNAGEAASFYNYIVFLINKVFAVILLPLTVLLAFAASDVKSIVITVAACIGVILLIYRYTLTLILIRKTLKISAIHFFLYLCAVEIMPMLIIYKVLFNQVGKSN